MSSQVLEETLSKEEVKENLRRVREKLEKAGYFPEFIKKVLKTARPLIEHPKCSESYEIWDYRHPLIPPFDIPVLRGYVKEFERELEVLYEGGLVTYDKRKRAFSFNYQPTTPKTPEIRPRRRAA